MSEIQWRRDGINIPWTWVVQNIWRILEVAALLAFGAHVGMTIHTQREQDKRMERVERILSCVAEQRCVQANKGVYK